MKSILIVDDETKIIRLARDYLENAGFSVHGASTAEQAAPFRAGKQPD